MSVASPMVEIRSAGPVLNLFGVRDGSIEWVECVGAEPDLLG